MKLEQLTFLRFMAASWVLIFHDWQLLKKYFTSNSFIGLILGNGNLAVPFFFTLSGFILALNYVNRVGDFRAIKRYILGRLFRIYPVYFLALMLTLVFEIHQHGLEKIIVNTFLIQSWLTSKFDTVINYPSWSLSIEFFLYLCFPGVIYFLRKIKTVKSLIIILGLITICWQSLCLSDLIYKIPNALSWIFSFLIGIVFGLFFMKKQYNNSMLTVLVGTLLIASVGFGYVNFWVNISLFCLGLGLFIYLLSGENGLITTILRNIQLVKLGEISYSVYILQYPIRLWFDWSFDRLNIHYSASREFLLYFLVIIIVSFVSYTFIEIPAKNRLGRVFRN